MPPGVSTSSPSPSFRSQQRMPPGTWNQVVEAERLDLRYFSWPCLAFEALAPPFHATDFSHIWTLVAYKRLISL